MSGPDDLAEVIELLERWRDANGIGRMQIGVEASRTISAMSPDRKRALAIEVAERVAPQLVPAIEAEEGDLTAQQVGAVVDLLRRADREQLDDLVTALRTGEVDDALVIVDDALDAISEQPGGEDEPQELGPGRPGRPPAAPDAAGSTPAAPGSAAAGAATAGAATAGAATAGVGATAAADESSAASASSDDEEGSEAEAPDDGVRAVVDGTADVVEEAAAAVLGDDEEIEVGADGRLELDEEAVRERMEKEAAERAKQYRESSPEIPRQPAYRAPAVDFTDRDLDLPDTSVDTVAPLRSRIADDRRAAGGGELAAPPVSGPVAAITARADGYRRRRAALRAIEDDRLDAGDVAAVVRSFDRGTDKAWIAGAALDAGVVSMGDLDGLGLSSAALDRLRRRAS